MPSNADHPIFRKALRGPGGMVSIGVPHDTPPETPRCGDKYNGNACERQADHKGQHWAKGGDVHWTAT